MSPTTGQHSHAVLQRRAHDARFHPVDSAAKLYELGIAALRRWLHGCEPRNGARLPRSTHRRMGRPAAPPTGSALERVHRARTRAITSRAWMPTISLIRGAWKNNCAFSKRHPEVDLTGGWAVLFAEGARRSANAQIPPHTPRSPAGRCYSFKLIHPTFMGKTSWFRRYRYRADAIRCEDHDLLFRACARKPVCQFAGDRAGLPARLHRFAKAPAIALDVVPLRGPLFESRRAPAGGRGGGIEGLPDVVAVAARADAAWLRSRSAALSEQELREWRQVWESVS